MHQKLNSILPLRSATLLGKEINVHTVFDLLYFFPRKYVDRTLQQKIFQHDTFISTVVEVESSYFVYQRRSQLIVRVRTEQGIPIELIWFHSQRYMQKMFTNHTKLFIFGKMQIYRSVNRLIHPDFEIIRQEDEGSSGELSPEMDRIVPFYSTTANLKKNRLDSRFIRRLIFSLLKTSRIPEMIDQNLLVRHHLLGRLPAIKQIHFPDNAGELESACTRLKYEELFALNCHIIRTSYNHLPKRLVEPLSTGQAILYQKLIANLPYQLTNDQNQAINKYFLKVKKNKQVRVLLQGDVGCGKTIVALAIGLHYVEAKYQIALLAPTEVLIKQHFVTLSQYLGIEYAHLLDLLTGTITGKNRMSVLQRINQGESQIILGTHSLFSSDVKFHNLGMVIIDEQHRFGVEQRKQMLSKGNGVDMLAMSATPIPRSLCLTTFSDLDLLLIKEKPKNRGIVKTMLFTENRRKGVYSSIRKYLSRKEQCFIVHPIIKESEKLDLKAAETAYQYLAEKVFPEFNVALIHGKKKTREKDQIMQQMKSGKIQLLISTSVIEVGVDIANATIMLIESAERFGLSQLHQLRGRIGRGKKDSFCVLMTQDHHWENPDTRKRLENFCTTADGFQLAELDLKQRGAGEVLGTKQHGFNGLLLSNLVRDVELVIKSNRDARDFMQIFFQQSELLKANLDKPVESQLNRLEKQEFWHFVDSRFNRAMVDAH